MELSEYIAKTDLRSLGLGFKFPVPNIAMQGKVLGRVIWRRNVSTSPTVSNSDISV